MECGDIMNIRRWNGNVSSTIKLPRGVNDMEMRKGITINAKNISKEKRDMLYSKLTKKHEDIYKRLAK